MANERYIKYVPHENNVNERFDAQHLNELQDGILELQRQSMSQADDFFLQRALFALEHQQTATAMIIDQFENQKNVDMSKSQYVSYSPDATAIVFDDVSAYTAVFQTSYVLNPTGKPVRKVMLLVDEYKPDGCTIDYEFSHDGESFYPIIANTANTLMVGDARAGFYIRVKFSRPDATVQPRLDAWAVLFDDETYRFRFLDDGIDVAVDIDWDGTIVS